METIFNSNFCEEQALIESTRLNNQPMPGDIVEYTTRYGDWYPDAHIDEVNENGISICEVASVPYVSKHNGKLSLGSVSGGSWTTIPTKLHKI